MAPGAFLETRCAGSRGDFYPGAAERAAPRHHDAARRLAPERPAARRPNSVATETAVNRRTFLAATATAVGSFALDPELALWTPGKRTFFDLGAAVSPLRTIIVSILADGFCSPGGIVRLKTRDVLSTGDFVIGNSDGTVRKIRSLFHDKPIGAYVCDSSLYVDPIMDPFEAMRACDSPRL